MNRILLRLWNAPGLLILFTIGIAVQTAFFTFYPLLYLQPDVVLVAVIWFALRREFTEGGVLTLILSDIAEIHSGAPQGLYLMTYMLLYLSIRGLARFVALENLNSLIWLTLFSSILWKLAGLGVLSLLGSGENQWRHTVVLLLPGALVEWAVGYWIYRGLEIYDWVTYKDERTRQALEDEMQLNEEGL